MELIDLFYRKKVSVVRSGSLPRSPSDIRIEPVLCAICLPLLSDTKWQSARRATTLETTFTRLGRIVQHTSLESLFYSASFYQCTICTAIWDRLQGSLSFQEVDEKYNRPGFEILWEFMGDDRKTLHVTRARPPILFDLGGIRPLVKFILVPQPGRIRYTPLSIDLDRSVTSLVSKWLATCQKHHTCHRPAETRMPTRLLSVQASDGHVRLTIHDKTCPTMPYATLSHVWGTVNHVVLNTKNIEDFKLRIPEQALPKCFQQAVFVARSIGIPYLWIDSLCILQDCAEDWAREAALMADVYGNSTLNIAMSSASNSNQGCFNHRNTNKLRVPVFDFAGPSRDTGEHEDEDEWETVYGDDGEDDSEDDGEDDSEDDGEDDDKYENKDVDDEDASEDSSTVPVPERVGLIENDLWWESHPCNQILETRAWVLQERLLSPRVLYLTDQEAFWECQETGCCETFPDGVPLRLMSKEFRDWGPDNFSTLFPNAGNLENGRPHRQFSVGFQTDNSKDFPGVEFATQWKHIVEEFCSRKLTVKGDKLIALSGIASALRSWTGNTYCAGLWQESLPGALLWYSVPSIEAKEEQGQCLAPSWSWASVQGQPALYAPRFWIRPGVPEPDLINVPGGPLVEFDHISGGSDDVVGSRAVMHLRGHLCTILPPDESWTGTSMSKFPLHYDTPHCYYHFKVRVKIGNDERIFELEDPLYLDSRQPSASADELEWDEKALLERRTFLVPILRGRQGMSALILVRQKNGKHKRIGVCISYWSKGKVQSRERLLGMLDGLQKEDIDIV